MDHEIVVVGGGIGGMTLAHAAARAGIGVTVVEASHRDDQQGTGISLLGNALRALDEVGLADAVIARGTGWDVVSNRDGDGNVVHEVRPPRTFRPDAPGAIGVMRTDLADVLAEHALASGAEIQYRTTVTSFENAEDGLRYELSDGTSGRCDVLVAADGVYSPTRAAAFGPDLVPTYVGTGAWRFTVERPDSIDGLAMYHSRTGSMVGCLPLRDDLCYFFSLEHSVERPHFADADLRPIFRERLSLFDAPEIRHVSELVDSDRYLTFRPFDALLVPAPWHRGRVVLLGDAAHSMTPQLTSGGGMAIEDAVVLADELARHDDAIAALAAYSTRRYDRVKKIFDTSYAVCMVEQQPVPDPQRAVELLMEGHGVLAQPY
jgi:2-polyprenyl-6-methoxyphenol hydroxylase-like FAD-dependent oxidoreductase